MIVLLSSRISLTYEILHSSHTDTEQVVNLSKMKSTWSLESGCNHTQSQYTHLMPGRYVTKEAWERKTYYISEALGVL